MTKEEEMLALADEIEAATVPIPRDLLLMKDERALICETLRAAAATPASEPVAWRWRYKNFPGDMGWIVMPTEPKGDDIDVQPLYCSVTRPHRAPTASSPADSAPSRRPPE